jgi:hypothetical protein
MEYRAEYFDNMDWIMTKLSEVAIDPALQARLLSVGGQYIEWGAHQAMELRI